MNRIQERRENQSSQQPLSVTQRYGTCLGAPRFGAGHQISYYGQDPEEEGEEGLGKQTTKKGLRGGDGSGNSLQQSSLENIVNGFIELEHERHFAGAEEVRW